MNGNCHFVFGTASCVLASRVAIALSRMELSQFFIPIDKIVYESYDPKMMVVAIVGLGLIGAIFPDIDNPKSLFGKLTYPVSKWISKIGTVSGHIYGNHRWVLHDVGFYLILMIGLYLIEFLMPMIGFFVGVFSHLALDSLNPSGIRIFGRVVRIAKIHSNSRLAVHLTWILSGIVMSAALVINYM